MLAALCCEATGCVRWHETTTQSEGTKSLPLSAPAPDTVDVETVLIRFHDEMIEELDQVWLSADESVFDFDQRRRLDSNGLRVGLIRGELPPVILRQLNAVSQQQKEDIAEAAGLGSDADARMRMLRCRAGRRKELIIRREVNRPLSVITSNEGRISGQTFYDRPTALFALTTFPMSNGTATIELIPEVQYGDNQHRYLTTDFGMRQELKRPSKVWKSLKIRAPMDQGNFLIVAATQPPRSLGAAFFVGESIQQQEEHLLLLIRLTATQLDDLFAEDQVQAARAMMEQK